MGKIVQVLHDDETHLIVLDDNGLAWFCHLVGHQLRWRQVPVAAVIPGPAEIERP